MPEGGVREPVVLEPLPLDRCRKLQFSVSLSVAMYTLSTNTMMT